MNRLIEAILLMASEPVQVVELATSLDLPEPEVTAALEQIAAFYSEHDRGMRLQKVAGGWRLATADDLSPALERWLVADQQTRLSQAALETLAVIAYLQPVTRGRVSSVRGVGVDSVVRTLLMRGLIQEAGTDPTTGAMTLETTSVFLEKLGIDSLDELPDLAPMLPDAVALDAELSQEHPAQKESHG